MENTVNHQTCIKCKLCIEVCPVNIIGVDETGMVNFIKERESICLECGQCMAICSTDSVKIKKYTYEKNFAKLPEHLFSHQQLTDFISSRRSVRNFKDKKVDKQTIEKILESLKYAPYGAEPNKVEITVVNDRATIEKALPLTEAFLDHIVKWIEHPIISRIIRYKKGIETFNTIKNHLYPIAKKGNYQLKYGDRITRGAPALLILHADKAAEEHSHNALIYATYLSFAIHALGMGGSMNEIIPAAINKDPKVRKIFHIPENHEAIISMMFGYPKYRYKKAVIREEKKIHWLNNAEAKS